MTWLEWFYVIVICIALLVMGVGAADLSRSGEAIPFCAEGVSPRGAVAHVWLSDRGRDGLVLNRFAGRQPERGPCPRSSPAGTRPDLDGQAPGADGRLRLLPTRTALGGERDAVRDFSDQEGGR